MSQADDEERTEARKIDEHVRHFWADDQQWKVREVRAPRFDRRGGVHLIFESVEIVRRVNEFPDNWYELPDAELYALSKKRPRRG
ncbi:MAG TPA: hypothetical protein VJ867_13500 [Gemmatimonadaceae bacterium]|nr:hypothetical protein [Gemmatimonadaceae bacterium]